MARTLLARARRALLNGLHLVGSRTVVIVGLLLACWTGYGAARNLWFGFTAKRAEGLVVQQVAEYRADWKRQLPGPLGAQASGVALSSAQRVYRALVRFTEGDREYRVLAEARGVVHVYPVGSSVHVVFPPGRPERARLRSEVPDAWGQAGLLFAATVLATGSARLWWHLVRRRILRRRVGKAAA